MTITRVKHPVYVAENSVVQTMIFTIKDRTIQNDPSGLRRSAFSLVELVIVIVIIGIIAAIAVPRISRGATEARANALRANLNALNRAVEYYAAEHNNQYPTVANFRQQLLQYTDINGALSTTYSSTFRFGPYLLKFPKIGVGPSNGEDAVGATATAGVAWVYDASTGKVGANGGTEKDSKGVSFSDY